MGQLGIGAMLRLLGGNEATVEAYHSALNKQIVSVAVADDELRFSLADGTKLIASDQGQSCCEHRYMHTDDDLASFAGSTFLGAEVREAPNEADEYGDHEVQFLIVNTSAGSFTIASHNEHNGYYGGFAIELRTEA